MSIRNVRLPGPRILVTTDLGDETYDGEIRPMLEVFARHRVPLTLFSPNRSFSGDENREIIFETIAFAKENRIPVEIASHSIDHGDLSHCSSDRVVLKVEESLKAFEKWGIRVHGFRAPYLGIESIYGDVLNRISGEGVSLVYDSSTCFESNLITSLFHVVARKKSPHRIGSVWELPISCLDDYHLLIRQNRGERFVYLYWVAEMRLWIRSLNYFMILLHPDIMISHLKLLDRFLACCRRRFPPEAFCTCQRVVNDLEVFNRPGVMAGNEV